MSKINVPRISFLETNRIIALSPPESNRKAKSKIASNCAAFSNAGFFRPHISSSCFYQIIMQEKHSYAHGNPLRTSHIAICEVKGNKQKTIHHNRSTNPKPKQYHIPHPKPIQSLKMSHQQMVKCEAPILLPSTAILTTNQH